MEMFKRAFGYVHILLALLIGVHYIVLPVYDYGGEEYDLWSVINFFTATGAIAAVFFSYLRWRAAGSSDDSRESIAASVMLIASLAFFVLFFEQWLASRLFADELTDAGPDFPNYRSLVWTVIDVVFPIISGVVGIHLLRETSSD